MTSSLENGRIFLRMLIFSFFISSELNTEGGSL
ncbi:hypothetical protein CP8484711_1254, partial [Chlamydia psittaci 84-8471/1]